MWKNTISFIAKLSAIDPLEFGFLYPIATVRDALEEFVPNGIKMDCKLWVATEWILQCGLALHWFFETWEDELEEDRVRAYRFGSLCRDMRFPLIGMERWHFWKKRLEEILENQYDFDLDTTTLERIKRAIQVMKDVEKGVFEDRRPKVEVRIDIKIVEDDEDIVQEEGDLLLWERILSMLRLPWKRYKIFLRRCRGLLDPLMASKETKSRIAPLKNKLRKIVRRW